MEGTRGVKYGGSPGVKRDVNPSNYIRIDGSLVFEVREIHITEDTMNWAIRGTFIEKKHARLFAEALGSELALPIVA